MHIMQMLHILLLSSYKLVWHFSDLQILGWIWDSFKMFENHKSKVLQLMQKTKKKALYMYTF